MEKKHAMAATDGQIVIAAARWSTEEVLSLRDYVAHADTNNQQPRTEVVKFVRGQYASLGVPNLPNPSLHPNAILTSFGKTLKVAAQNVKFKDGKRHCAVASGLRFSIPESYPGYFEILSEEGKAVRCIESVLELAKKFPDCVLVRENIRAFVTAVPLLELSADKSRTVSAGEILTLKKEVSLAARSRCNRFLQCLDSKGDIVYLNLEQRGKFSPIARNDNISGVHSLRQLITNKRLPLMVRLVWGPPPFKGTSGVAQPSELRLFSTFEEDSVFALPLGHSSKDSTTVVPLPLGCNLKLVRARNHAEIRHKDNFQRLAGVAARMAKEIHSRMTVLETFKDSISFWNISPGHSKFAGKVSPKNYFLRRSISHESQIVMSPVINDQVPTESVAPTQDFLEIDQIYDYVRGFAPLPKNLRGSNFEKQPEQQKPKPPPIETIPTNKLNAAAKAKQPAKAENKKPSSKTALKMERHAQNLAQESLKSKRLFKSKTTSSIADHLYTAEPEKSSEKPVIDLSSTHLLTQADLVSPSPAKSDSDDDDPTYENTTQVYLESSENTKQRMYARQKATSEIGPTLRETSPYKKNSSSHNESSRNLIIRNKHKRSSAGDGTKSSSKSHEDLATKCQSQPNSPSSNPEQHPLYNSLSNLRLTPPSTDNDRRRHLSKQRSLSSLLAEASPNTPVIEHKPVELHLHLSRNGNQKHHTKSKASKLGIMYL
ncbi:uncharacterized protein LOC132198055 [Neocloeon triangulifer]|uniref:uncharacterized protein LOC132198055 n=1 Tax=Neocloeon triangulifer TaxID=2078957 RepID=UPI00286F48F1|nr:uncharacterized protein LOC132198055 [Neocloeon triangulifer]